MTGNDKIDKENRTSLNNLVNRTVRLDIKIRQKKSLMSKTQGLKKRQRLTLPENQYHQRYRA